LEISEHHATFLPSQSIDGIYAMRKRTSTLSSKFQFRVPEVIRTARRWQTGQIFAFVPKGQGMLLVPVPKRDELAGLARGAKPESYRDRTDRV
jgi:bifunctional DNA-binding transcriptional regulator/antitoxin component of YhaV-PrlF toxin-antitoxin module